MCMLKQSLQTSEFMPEQNTSTLLQLSHKHFQLQLLLQYQDELLVGRLWLVDAFVVGLDAPESTGWTKGQARNRKASFRCQDVHCASHFCGRRRPQSLLSVVPQKVQQFQKDVHLSSTGFEEAPKDSWKVLS